ncbi:hypothetical protein D3C86_1627940 [compost metagenome]
MHARNVAELDRLAGQGESSGDNGLGGNHRGQGRQAYQRDQRPARRKQIERVARGFRITEQQSTLTEVIQHQRWQHQNEPRAGNRLAAEVAHVGVQRFGTGQGQYHRAQDCHAHAGMNDEETHAPHRVHRLQHFRVLNDAVDTQCPQHHKPGHHDRSEQNADARGAMTLDEK